MSDVAFLAASGRGRDVLLTYVVCNAAALAVEHQSSAELDKMYKSSHPLRATHSNGQDTLFLPACPKPMQTARYVPYLAHEHGSWQITFFRQAHCGQHFACQPQDCQSSTVSNAGHCSDV